ncbi:MAG: glycosyltransferase [Gammaproteobacteria bacterium]|nr:glycosyltransferase [Gammaproteobacteria bacterium]
MSIPNEKRQRVCLLAYNTIANDPRVRRQGDAFAGCGWEVRGIGLLQQTDAVPPIWLHDEDCVQDTSHYAEERKGRPTVSVWTKAIQTIYQAVLHLTIRMLPRLAGRLYWQVVPVSTEFYKRAKTIEADIWVANDWYMLPLALRLREENGGKVIYDSHELAVEEGKGRLIWRLLRRPLVAALEAEGIGRVDAVMTVSQGIADYLYRKYSLDNRPSVIRSVPPYESPPEREDNETLKILYHGLLSPGRGLECCIEAASLWKNSAHLFLRGPVNQTYEKALRREIRKWGVEEKVVVLPPVPADRLVQEATLFDVGIFVLSGDTMHNRHVLPNKFFEYIMAGLCVCVSNLPEMRHIVETFDIGKLIPSPTAKSIADVVDSLDPDSVVRFKSKSQKAGELLCWERESQHLIELANAVLSTSRQEM